MKNKRKRIFFLIPVIIFPVLYFVVFNGRNKAAEEALSWFPADADKFAFDNWKQIRNDFGFDAAGFKKGDWIPKTVDEFGNKRPGEPEKDNMGQYAGGILQKSGMEDFDEKCGLLYPEIEWEAKAENLTAIKPGAIFNAEAFANEMIADGYATEEFEGQKIWWYDFKDSLKHARILPLAYQMSAVAYVEKENILLISYSRDVLHRSLEVHKNKASLKEKAGVAELIKGTASFENMLIQFRPPSLNNYFASINVNSDKDMEAALWKMVDTDFGLSIEEVKALNKPEMLLFGERDMGEIISVLMFREAAQASGDEALREKILNNGKSMLTKEKLAGSFKDISVSASGKLLKMKWKTAPYRVDGTNAALNADFPWAIYSDK